MYKLFPGKSPFQMRREAEQRGKPKPKVQPPGKIDPSQFPTLAAETPGEVNGTIDWLAHVQAGRIEVK